MQTCSIQHYSGNINYLKSKTFVDAVISHSILKVVKQVLKPKMLLAIEQD